jgi:hypothetical protein
MSQEKKKEEDFHDFHDFHMNSFNELNDNGLNDGADLDEFVNFEAMDLDTKYRSISSLPSTNPVEFNLMTRSLPPAGKEASLSLSDQTQVTATQSSGRDQPKATMTAPKIEVTPSTSVSRSTSGGGKSSRPIAVPPEPFYVAPSTHFLTKQNVGDMKARVEVELKNQPGLSFEFFPAKCRWEGVYLDGAARCKFEINVYKRSSGGLVVEGNRLSGDSYAFINIYKAVRNAFDASSETNSEPPLPVPPSRRVPDASAIQSSITAVLAMANSGIGEAQVGAAQIFCNLASDHSMHSALLSNECIPD